MSTKKPPTPSAIPQEEQDRSIRARKTQLFDESNPEIPIVKKMPFAFYLKTVPGAPLTPLQKQVFWGLAGFLGLLLLAAIRSHRR